MNTKLYENSTHLNKESSFEHIRLSRAQRIDRLRSGIITASPQR